jgi:phosphoribosylcarboxyaminoimidazole (NCAIR) mutase
MAAQFLWIIAAMDNSSLIGVPINARLGWYGCVASIEQMPPGFRLQQLHQWCAKCCYLAAQMIAYL